VVVVVVLVEVVIGLVVVKVEVDVEVDVLVGVPVVDADVEAEVDVEVEVEAVLVEDIKLDVEVEVDVVVEVDDEEEVSDWVGFGIGIVKIVESRFSVELGDAVEGNSLVLELSGLSLEETASLRGAKVASDEISTESTDLLVETKRIETSLVVCKLLFVLFCEGDIPKAVLLRATGGT